MSPAVIARAAQLTAHQGTAQVRIRGTMHMAGQDASLSGNGVLSTDPGRRLGRLSFSADASGGRVAVRELFFKDAIYIGGGPFGFRIPNGKPWMRIDPRRAAGVDLSRFDAGIGSASQGLAYLQQARDVTKLGVETVDGARTTHYHASIDGRQVGPMRTLPADVWIDASRRVRRYEITLPGQALTTDMTIDFVRFGVVLSMQRPRSGDVFDATALVRRGLRRAG